jgi:hypothetical protein
MLQDKLEEYNRKLDEEDRRRIMDVEGLSS